ncbi:MAG: hypothetical protein RRA63_02945 [Candidatus Calescibacterium sp.]|jgi:hypothetical protein|nr:hypothetical protein [Candidatus Calescibacterium sp.]
MVRRKLKLKKRRGKKKKSKGKRKSKGSPVERVEAVAVAGGSKVCMSQKLIANKPFPKPILTIGCYVGKV